MSKLFNLAASALALLLAGTAVGDENAKAAPPTLGTATTLLQTNDVDGAIKILQTITARDRGNARAWRVLGLAWKKKRDWDQALTAYQKALQAQPDFATTPYAIGTIYALRGDMEKAFAWLGKAKASKADLTGVAEDEDLATLRSDPRFAALRMKPDDFADPFVEKVKVIHEWDGEEANDQFGWIARRLGDVDGDKIPDFVTSAPTSSAGGELAGRVYVYSTGTGKLLWQATGRPNDHLGSGLECAGDVNGDGIPDVVASAPWNGVAYVYSGQDGKVLQTFRSHYPGEEAFGQHADGAGDVNHDGYSDVMIGAPPPPNAPPGKGIGHAYLFSGKDGRRLLTLSGEREGDRFGSGVTGYTKGDLTFLVVGAPKAGPEQKGRTYVYDGRGAKPRFVIEGDETGVALGGMFVSVVGDVDADGMPDIYTSDWQNAAKGSSTGRIYVHSGKDGRRLLTLSGETEGEGFGTCPGLAGDVDHDGHDDLIVGAWQYGGGAVSGGRASLYSGKSGKLLKTYTCRTPGDTFGFDAVGVGDVDADETVDFLITSGWSGVSGFHSGRVFLISSGIEGRKD